MRMLTLWMAVSLALLSGCSDIGKLSKSIHESQISEAALKATEQGDWAKARDLLEGVVKERQESGDTDDGLYLSILLNLGSVQIRAADMKSARATFEQLQAIACLDDSKEYFCKKATQRLNEIEEGKTPQ